MTKDKAFIEMVEAATTPEGFADLMREAENIHIENLNGRDTQYTLTGDVLKGIVDSKATEVFRDNEEAYNEYIDICNSMGI